MHQNHSNTMFKILVGWSPLSQLARSPSNDAAAEDKALQQSDIKMAKSKKVKDKGSATLKDAGGSARQSSRRKHVQPSAEDVDGVDDNTSKKRRAVTPGKDTTIELHRGHPPSKKKKTQPAKTQPSTKLPALNDKSSRDDEDGELATRSRGVGGGGASSILGVAEEIEGDSLEVKKLKRLLRMQHEQVIWKRVTMGASRNKPGQRRRLGTTRSGTLESLTRLVSRW